MKPLIGNIAPEFKAKAVVEGQIVNDFSLSQFKDKYVVLFFYPLDFTFVCPTELHAFQEQLEEFEKRNAQVIGCSVDSVYSHLSWLNTPKNKGGIEGVDYPLISDINKTIASDYGVLFEEEGIAYRGLFLIDTKGLIRHQVINDLPLGRSVEEVLRMLDALIYFEKHGEVCPANWAQGKKSMKPTAIGLSQYFAT
jgi:peroxiredoxin (alkyl hydroperoxide reductase subunit C)